MDGLNVFVVALLGVVSCSRDRVSGSEVTVSPGDNITLYCDCKLSTEVGVVWYRNCSHQNQPPLVLKPKLSSERSMNNAFDPLEPFSHFQFARNRSSESYDLVILNITDSDEGLYYCGTEESKVEDKGHYITSRCVHRYGNVTTRIILDSGGPHATPQNSSLCWTLLFSLCLVFAGVSFLLTCLLVYHLCRKTAEELQVDQ